jgi:hypothetical protein
MEHQAENSLRETSGDGNGQGQHSDENEGFHWTCLSAGVDENAVGG